jgi:hypothetical protein
MYLLNYIKKCINFNNFQMMYYNHKLQKFLKLIYILTHQNVFIWYGIDALNVYMCVHVKIIYFKDKLFNFFLP